MWKVASQTAKKMSINRFFAEKGLDLLDAKQFINKLSSNFKSPPEKRLMISEMEQEVNDMSQRFHTQFPTKLTNMSHSSDNTPVVNTVGIDFNFVQDGSDEQLHSIDAYSQYTHQSLFSFDWNSKLDHSNTVFRLMQYYYGPFKMISLYLFSLVVNAILLMVVVKLSPLGKYMEDVLFETIRNGTLNEIHNEHGQNIGNSLTGLLTAMFQNWNVLRTLFIMMSFFLGSTLLLVGISLAVLLGILHLFRTRTIEKLKHVTRTQTINIKDDSLANSKWILFEKSRMEREFNMKYLIGFASVVKRENENQTPQGASIHKYVLERLLLSNDTSNSSVFEIDHFLLKRSLTQKSEETNYALARQLLLFVASKVIRDFKGRFLVIHVPNLQYGLMQLCENLGFKQIFTELITSPLMYHTYAFDLNSSTKN